MTYFAVFHIMGNFRLVPEFGLYLPIHQMDLAQCGLKSKSDVHGSEWSGSGAISVAICPIYALTKILDFFAMGAFHNAPQLLEYLKIHRTDLAPSGLKSKPALRKTFPSGS